MKWSDEILNKEVERARVSRAVVSAVHEQVSQMNGDEKDRLLVYLAVIQELGNSVIISIRTEQSRQIILAHAEEIRGSANTPSDAGP